MRPKPRSAMPGATRRVMLYAPRTLTAKMRSHSSPVTSRKGVGDVMPALLTRAPTGGTEPSRAPSALSTDVSSVMSQPTPTLAALRPRSRRPCAALVQVEDGDVPAGGGQGVRGGAPDAALGACSGDDSGLSDTDTISPETC